MFQIIRMVVSVICGFPLPLRIILSFILPILVVGIGSWVNPIFWLLVFCPVYFTNGWLAKDSNGERTFMSALKSSLAIMYAVVVVIYLVGQFSICAVSDAAAEYGLG